MRSLYDEGFVRRALLIVDALASDHATFTTDDVWAALDTQQAAIFYNAPDEPRLMGVVMQTAQRQGVIRPTMVFKRSERPVCNKRPVRVWESLAFNRRAA